MEKINGKQVVRIGVVGFMEQVRVNLITAMCKVRKKKIGPIKADAATMHNKFKVGFKEVDLETDKLYYKLIHFPNRFEYEQYNHHKSTLMEATKIDVIVLTFGDFSLDDVFEMNLLYSLQKPIAGIFFNHTENGYEETVDSITQEILGQFEFDDWIYVPEDICHGHLGNALSRHDYDPDPIIVNFISALDNDIPEILKRSSEQGIYLTDKIKAFVWSVGSDEGFQTHLKDGQTVVLDISKVLVNATIKDENHTFLDERHRSNQSGIINNISLNLASSTKLSMGQRFFLKVDGRIDGVGVVSKIKSFL